MKQITEPAKRTAANAWGQDSTVTVTLFEVQAADVGKSRPDYLGHNRPPRTFQLNDVGRQVEVMTAPGYTCWHFLNLQGIKS